MIVNSIKLENIRSYVNEKIEFPDGNVLLAGDIGSGKSTILLALEFALFGLSKGVLSGEALLRKGKREGSVEVNLEIGGKEHIIKRTLKNVGEKVSQSAGYIIADGMKKEGTAQELKSHILNLLNYPQEILTKKSLIFRYTVYTPQEAMKKILLDDKESRLDTLRKVFQIDKYKKIRENTGIYVKHLRERVNLYKGQLEGLEDKKTELGQKLQALNVLQETMQVLLPKLKSEKENLAQQRKKLNELEQKQERYHNMKRELSVSQATLKEKLAYREKNSDEIEKIKQDIKKISYDLSSLKLKKPDSNLEELQEKIKNAEKQFLEANNSLQQLHGKKEHLEKEQKQILELDDCPTCKQPVSENHKKEMQLVAKASLDNISRQLDQAKAKKAKYELELQELREAKDLAQKQKQEYQMELQKEQLLTENTAEKQDRIELLNKLQEEIKQEIGALNSRMVELTNGLSLLSDIEELNERLPKEKEILDELQQKAHVLEVQRATLEQDIKNNEEIVLHLKKEVEKKEKAKQKLHKIQHYHNWLNDFFVQLMSTMEKHVMLQVHGEFNNLFQEWFNILLPDENVSIRLDDEFTPMIEQNGYEVELDNMSGGEKTAVALAYRLALNKVINNLIQNINTKDLLILDEPTDGFSTEQLDRMREVLDLLGLKQVIIVSHENKIESFVNNVVRVEKNEHISRII
ncbi:AAA family ATPase [Candidatus Woesearchaeota archaeon]|nr:AAA family ATPase [Candidatus Woesearchaeota archaeon]